jgi:NTE family protein
MSEIDLVLSGSGIKFPVFVGSLEAIIEKYEIKRIAGTSGGGLVAAAYASGISVDRIKQILLDTDFRKFRDFSLYSLFFKFGIFSGNRLEKWLDNIFEGKCFKDLEMECKVIATDLMKSDYVVFSNTNTPNEKLSKAVRMSISIPFVFGYVNKLIVDGFITGNYLIDIFDDNERPTIGLLVKSTADTSVEKRFIFIWNYISYILEAFQRSNENQHISEAHWANTIPINVEGFSSISFNMSKDDKIKLMKIGYDAVRLNKKGI